MIGRYAHIPTIENNEPMVDIEDYPFVAEPAYYQRGLTDSPKLYTRKAVADKLVRLQETLLSDYQFKIWDPWRPSNLQATLYWKCWNEFKAKNPEWDDQRLHRETAFFVMAPDAPGCIPSHATGGAIDLTLIDRKTGLELDMGTGFDHFGPEAYRDYFEHAGRDITVRDNRRILDEAMSSAGFIGDVEEWWHFDYGNQRWAAKTKTPAAIYGKIVSIIIPAPGPA